jgi:hypothetical protein
LPESVSNKHGKTQGCCGKNRELTTKNRELLLDFWLSITFFMVAHVGASAFALTTAKNCAGRNPAANVFGRTFIEL